MAVPSFEKQNRTIIDLKGTWKKERFAADHNLSLTKRDEAGYNALIAEAGNRHLISYDAVVGKIKNFPQLKIK